MKKIGIISMLAGLLFMFSSCAAINSLIGPPSVPQNLHATIGNGEIVLDWSAATGATSYNIYYKAGQTVSVSDYDKKIPSIGTISYKVTPLTNGSAYSFIVIASNSNGDSGSSAVVTATPATVLAAPTSLTLVPAPGQVTVTWTGLGATSYTLYYEPGATVAKTDASAIKVADLTGTTTTVTGLTNASTYAFILTATNTAGESLPSDAATVVVGDHLSVWTNLDPAQSIPGWWDIIVNQFEAANTGIILDISHKGATDATHTDKEAVYRATLQAAATAGTLPDIFFTFPDSWFIGHPIAGSPLAKNLNVYLAADDPQLNKFLPPVYWENSGPGDARYQLASAVTSSHIMYSNDALRAALGLPSAFPATLADLLAEGRAIAAYNVLHAADSAFAPIVPIAITDGDRWPIQSCLLSTLMDRTGEYRWFWDAVQGLNGKSFNDPQFVKALEVLEQLVTGGMFMPNVATATYSQDIQAFKNGQAVYLVNGDWGVYDLQNMSIEPSVSIHAFPDVLGPSELPAHGASGSTTSIPGEGFSINANLSDARAADAWKWIWHYTGPIGAKIRLQYGNPMVTYKFTDVSGFGLNRLAAEMVAFKIGVSEFSAVLDQVFVNAGTRNNLEDGIMGILLGTSTPTAVAASFETYVATYDNHRPH